MLEYPSNINRGGRAGSASDVAELGHRIHRLQKQRGSGPFTGHHGNTTKRDGGKVVISRYAANGYVGKFTTIGCLGPKSYSIVISSSFNRNLVFYSW